MRPYKIILSVGLLLITALAAYSAFMYVYSENMFAPVSLLAAPQAVSARTEGLSGYTRFIHQVNTPQRARQKDASFPGFEVDVWVDGDLFLAAHDEHQARTQTPLATIFESVQDPAAKLWWLDLKQPLSAAQLAQLVNLTANYQIPPEHLLFEVSAGPTADLLQKQGLLFLLQLPEGFAQDNGLPARRAELNEQVRLLWEKYHPAAISASFGKYAYLQAYFPYIPKAIYYSSTVRPSLKKYFMAQHIQKDPSVRIFMTDEYTYLPF